MTVAAHRTKAWRARAHHLLCVLALAVPSALGTAACAGWTRLEAPWSSQLRPRQQVQVWRGDEVRVLHGVVMTTDSLRGVPFHLPLTCTRCQVAFARTAIDSIRLGNSERSGAAAVGVVVGMFAVLAAIISRLPST